MSAGTLLTIFVGVIISVLSGIILWKVQNMAKKSEERYAERATMEKKERHLLNANSKLSELTARCVRGEHVNGDLEKAVEYQVTCRHDLEDAVTELQIDHTGGIR